MTVDLVTLHDLSFFKGEINIFSLINRCTTQSGSDVLRKHLMHPPTTYELLLSYQQSVLFWSQHIDDWPTGISNGTIVMIEKFFENAEAAHLKPNVALIWIDTVFRKLLKKNDYSFTQFSVSHIVDLLKGCNELTQLSDKNPPPLVQTCLDALSQALSQPLCQEILNIKDELTPKQILHISYHVRRELKRTIMHILTIYAHLDAMYGMAKASIEHGWQFPDILPSKELIYTAQQLYHPLLKQAQPYQIHFSKDKNFLFLTGANMSGKSTLIRALGIGAVLAHIGMAVPAADMQISFLESIISNMQVEDNILKGESYFYAEVNRMKVTAEKIHYNHYNLVLMDELFKGTNVHDAYECTRAVIEGLMEQHDNLLALSTHLYELAENITSKEQINFNYFETVLDASGDYHFTYHLKEGVSNDRIGFWVMKKEGVLDLLKR